MNNRLELHQKLVGLIGNDNVYFQPPASVKMSYPCVVYNVGTGNAKYANDSLYNYTHRYDVTFIYKKPNLEIIEQVLSTLPKSSMSRSYCVENLNHYVFSVYY